MLRALAHYVKKHCLPALRLQQALAPEQEEEEENSAIVNAIVTLAHMLNMDVIAEGIETTAQLDRLKMLKCEHGQGYFFSKPLSREEAEELIASSPQW